MADMKHRNNHHSNHKETIGEKVIRSYDKADSFFGNIGERISDFFGFLSNKIGSFFGRVGDSVENVQASVSDRVAENAEKRSNNTEDADYIAAHASKYPAIDRLRIVLLFFLCIYLYGFPTPFGGIVQTAFSFVPMAFFIISGYLVLHDSKNRSARIVRAIMRTAIAFIIMAVVLFAINLIYYRLLGANVLPALARKRFWFNFIVMNVWQFDIGGIIWYVQSLLYAYIIIYFLDKLKLLKFDWLIALLLIIFTVITGELSGVIKWNILGYTYLPGNFITRALPYTLLGCFIRRKIDKFRIVGIGWYFLGIFAGIILIFVEQIVLGILGKPGYYGHEIGMLIAAVSICMIGFHNPHSNPGFEYMLGVTRKHTNIIYYICQPVAVLLIVLFALLGTDTLNEMNSYIGILTFIICFFIAWLAAFIQRKIAISKSHKNSDGHKHDDKSDEPAPAAIAEENE